MKKLIVIKEWLKENYVRELIIISLLMVTGVICIVFTFMYGEGVSYWKSHDDILKANHAQLLCEIFAYSALFLWLGAYPLSSLIRFLIWSIWTKK